MCFYNILTFPRPEVNGQVYNTGSAPAGECSFSSIFGRLPVVSNLTTLCLQGFPPFIKVFSINNKGHFDTKIQKISHSKTRHHRTHSITLRAQINDSDNCVTFADKCQLPWTVVRSKRLVTQSPCVPFFLHSQFLVLLRLGLD